MSDEDDIYKLDEEQQKAALMLAEKLSSIAAEKMIDPKLAEAQAKASANNKIPDQIALHDDAVSPMAVFVNRVLDTIANKQPKVKIEPKSEASPIEESPKADHTSKKAKKSKVKK